MAKAADETGLTAELLRHMPDDIYNALLQLFNHMLFSGEVPAAWRKTLFKMLPKTSKPRTTTDFRPIASIRLLYKVFAYMILGRIEDTLETNQPEEQHGFRSNRRIEEHLLTLNVILDKTLEMDQPLWIISLDLSKAFDRVNWESLWQAVGDHGASPHLVWILQNLYYQQRGKIVGSMVGSFEFDIAAGVRQGCVLSPRLICSILEWALSKCRPQCHGVGYDFQDGGFSLLDLRFADDILIFAKSYEEIGHVLDMLVDALGQVGLVFNAGKTKKKLTTQSQHPAKLVSPGGIVVEILEQDRAHKWLGCMISTHADGSHGLDLEHHLQAASRAFYANNPILSDKSVSISQRLAYFDAMASPAACFAGGHRKMYKQDLRKLDIKFRRLVRTIVGPPGGLDWSAPWHDILHRWNARVLKCVEQAGVKLWSQEALGTTLEISNLHCQPSRQPLVETCPSLVGRTKEKDWKTKRHMGCANTNALPMEKFGRMESRSNADRCLADTYGLLY